MMVSVGETIEQNSKECIQNSNSMKETRKQLQDDRPMIADLMWADLLLAG